MKLRFDPAAVNEAIDAALYYERQRQGLGREFDNALEAGLQRILESPERWPQLGKKARRFLLKRFPYGIVYTVTKDEVAVHAVMHLRRRPGYWADRL
jgi:toxin ParE1/3/4